MSVGGHNRLAIRRKWRQLDSGDVCTTLASRRSVFGIWAGQRGYQMTDSAIRKESAPFGFAGDTEVDGFRDKRGSERMLVRSNEVMYDGV